jgi:hypothetical protein
VIHPTSRSGDTGNTHRRARSFAVVGVVLAVLLGGCAGLSGQTPAGASTPVPQTTDADGSQERPATTDTTTTAGESPERRTKAGPSALGSTLYGLVQADNRTRYAEDHGLQLRDDSVHVTVELRDGRALPEEIDAEVTARAESQVDAYVPIDQLVALARHENTTSVRAPEAPEPLNAAVSRTH